MVHPMISRRGISPPLPASSIRRHVLPQPLDRRHCRGTDRSQLVEVSSSSPTADVPIQSLISSREESGQRDL